jgi:hypothetical protein
MKIGIYKPYKTILFNDEKDTNSWSREVVNFMKILANHNHQIHILSDTDYNRGIMNVYKNHIDDELSLDYLVVFNGCFNRDQYTETDILDRFDCKKILVESDILLVKSFHDEELYDIILTQSPDSGKRKYAHIEKLIAFEHDMWTPFYLGRKASGVFVGYERDRTDKILEYVYRPNITWRGKGETFNFENKALKSELNKLLQEYLYTIIISGPVQTENNFVSQRYFEGCLNGIINFVDDEYDNAELLIKKDDWRRVKSFGEMLEKINTIDIDKYYDIQRQQEDEVRPWISGDLFYEKLVAILKW